MAKVKWKRKPDAHDYPAASTYLSLLVAESDLRDELVSQLQASPLVHYRAKDLLRASQLPALPKSNPHVALDLKKIRKKQPLSPVLLVRGDLVRGFPLQVADGYHRVCASLIVDENTDIPCRLIDLPKADVARPASRRTPSVPAAAAPAVVVPAAVEPPVAVEVAPPAKRPAKQPAVAAAAKPRVRRAAVRKTVPPVAD